MAEVCRVAGVDWRARSIADDAELTARYGELIPVVLVDGRQHAIYRVDPQELAAALG